MYWAVLSKAKWCVVVCICDMFKFLWFRSGQHSSQIDFIFTRREDKRDCLDCKVILGECVVPQHKFVVVDFRLRVHVHRDKRAKIARTKWWKLRGEAAQAFKERMLGEGPWEEEKTQMTCG